MTGRLRATVVPVPKLPRATIDAMWALFSACYEDVDRGRFEADLARKQRVILLRDGEVVAGFSTMTEYAGTVDGRPYKVVFSGDTVIAEPYWGQTALQRAFALQVFLTWLTSPLTRTYWYLISKGYKTYLLLARNWIHAWPRRDGPTPPFEARVLRDVSIRLFGDQYDPERGVVTFDTPMGRVRPGLAEPPPDDPDVRFFLEHNPRYADGVELCCLGRLELSLFLYFALRQALPFLRARKR